MKFLQLRHAIEIALGGVRVEPDLKLEPRTIPLYDPDKHKGKREIVAGGDILWKPVNRQTALIIAKAPWWALPPETQQEPSPLPEPKRKRSHRIHRRAATVIRCEEPLLLAHIEPTPTIKKAESEFASIVEIKERFVQ